MTARIRNFLAGSAVACAALLATAAPASAQSKALIVTFSKLDVALTGHIEDRCELAGGGNISFGELAGHKTVATTLSLNCNVPFDLGLQSTYGGLSHATMPMGQGPYAGNLAYLVSIRVPTLSPQPATLQGSFNSAELKSRRTLSSGDAIAAGGASLEFQTQMPTGAGLLAGDYSETFTVTLTARL